MKTILQYLIMVVAVLIAIFAVLRWGEILQAPPSVHGDWRLAQSLQVECPALASLRNPDLLSISQSGLYLEIKVGGSGGPIWHGRLNGNLLTVAGLSGLSLTLNQQAEPQTLSGELRFPGCEIELQTHYLRQPVQSSMGEGTH
jgi:hypothetical protein